MSSIFNLPSYSANKCFQLKSFKNWNFLCYCECRLCRGLCVPSSMCQLKDSINGRDVGVDADNLNTMFETGNDVYEPKIQKKNTKKKQ